MPSVEAGCEPGDVPNRDTLRRDGPVLKVQIGFDPDCRPPLRPNLPERRWTALVDTGADHSLIDVNLAGKLGLSVVDTSPVTGVSGTTVLGIYTAQIVVPELETTFPGDFQGALLWSNGLPYDAILGRDFLSGFNMNYDGPTGSVMISPRNSQG